MYDKKTKQYPITTDNIKDIGGKDMILKRMVNHYVAIANVKAKIDIQPPLEHISKTRTNLKNAIDYKEEYHNVRETYKKVSSIGPMVDNKKPFTFDKKPKGKYNSCKERYENMEHVRCLEAMSKRILSIGKPHERKKNQQDPLANPTYFFRKPEDSDAMKVITLNKLHKKLKELNDKEHNKLLLGGTIYKSLGKPVPVTQENPLRAQSAYAGSLAGKRRNTKDPKKILAVDIDPEKYIKIHKNNRDVEGKTIGNKTKEENKSKMSQSKSRHVQSIENNKKIPLYEQDELDAEKKFKDRIIQLIIEYKIFSDEDFSIFYNQLKQANCPDRLTEGNLEKIVYHIKNILDE